MGEADAIAQPVTENGPAANRKAALWIFAASVVAMLTTMFSPPLLRMFSSEIWQSLGMTEVEWSIMLAARGLFLVFFILAAGVLGDLYGRRRVRLLALLGYLMVSLIAATTSRRVAFLVMENLLPLFDAFIKTMTVTLLLLPFFDERRRVYAFTAYSAIYLGAFWMSPWFAEQIGEETGTRAAAYTASVIFGLAGIVLVSKKVPESRASENIRLRNVIALAAWVAGLCTVIFAVLLAGTLGWSSPLVWGTLAIGGAILVALAWLRVHPLGKRWRLAVRFERRLSVAVFAGVILNLGLYAVAVQVFNFLRHVQGYAPLTAALRSGPILVSALLLGGVAAHLTIRVGARRALSLGLLIVAASAAGFAFLQPDIQYWVLAVLLALLGLGFVVGNAPYLLLLSASVPRDLAGTVQAIGRSTAQLGGALAYALMLALIVGFSERAFVRTAESAALSQAAIQQQLSSLASAAGDTSLALAPETEIRALELIVPGFQRAYTVGLSGAMLVLAGMCVFGAAIVRVGLRKGQDE
jgi:MFS family permease